MVLVGDNPASQSYVRGKNKAAHEIGMHSEQHNLAAETSETDLLYLVEKLNRDPEINGILVQLPLPKQHQRAERDQRNQPRRRTLMDFTPSASGGS